MALAKSAPSKGRTAKELPEKLRRLTPLDLKPVRQISQGITTREIAAALDVSSRTLENYHTAIGAKLQPIGPKALSRYALTQFANLLR